MTVLEILLSLLTIFLLVLFLRSQKGKLSYIVLTLLIVVFTLHLLIDSITWQGYPLYIAIFMAILWMVVFLQYNLLHRIWLRRTLLISTITLLFVSVISILSFPTYQLPTPTGTYDIGTTSLTLVDDTRLEQYSEDSSLYRKIQLQFWYPTEDTEGYELVPWLEDGTTVSRALAKDTGLPAFVLDHTAEILSNSYKDAPIQSDQGQYPIIVISHGWRGFRNLHTDFAEELASQGYIVVSIDHTYGSVATVFDNGDIAPLNLDALPPREINDHFLEDANQLVETYGNDVIATLDYLEVLHNSSGSFFGGRLDLNTIGLVGHSTGGGGDAYVAIHDDRVDAVFGLDSWVEPIVQEDLDQGLDVPALFVRSGAWEEGENNAYLYDLINASSTASLYQVDGTTHYDFSMVYMYSPLTKYIGFTGDVDGRELNQILTTMMVDFFQINLLNDSDGTVEPTSLPYVRSIVVPE